MTMPGYWLYKISFLLFLLIFGRAPCLNADDGPTVPRISADQLNQRLGSPETAIIDVRKPRNWWRTSKKILTARREDPSKVDQWAPKYSKNQTLIFY
ncbi:hypothetical protein JY97_02485 [Alkalispirochaeta odontotermitis]|nr:hypothetical protein JY97_02485 [Alkalispirochaeta odontotermitis]CAB1068701.1 hypothetical protein D1AOALGA4SA_437 [Olavius algarvensis Delta 1 endosymbiont]